MSRQSLSQPFDGKPQAVPRVLGVPDHNREQSQEREHAARQGEQKEFDRRVTTVFASPDANQEEQRNQRELEEDVEQQQVTRREHSQATRFQQQKHAIEQGRPVLDRVPTHQYRSQQQERRQSEQPDAKAIESNAEPDVGQPFTRSRRIRSRRIHSQPRAGPNPSDFARRERRRAIGWKIVHHGSGQRQRGDGDDQRRPPHRVAAERREAGHRQRPGQRQKNGHQQ